MNGKGMLDMPDLTPSRDTLRADLLRRNREISNKHRGQRCFVIGTGPSIKEQDLTGLQ